MSHFTDTLNPAQKEAVLNYDKPSLIVAGAGSGKTRVLTSRIAYMIEQGVHPGSILALTFTNKAAREMRERIEQLVPDGRKSRLVYSHPAVEAVQKLFLQTGQNHYHQHRRNSDQKEKVL